MQNPGWPWGPSWGALLGFLPQTPDPAAANCRKAEARGLTFHTEHALMGRKPRAFLLL